MTRWPIFFWANMEMDMVADMKVDKVADMVAKVFKNKCITPEMF